MKLTLKIKLLPTEEQSKLLLETITEANKLCNTISQVAWETKTFNVHKLHHLVYYRFKEIYNLSSQILIRCIAKVVDSYKLDRKVKREFRPLGSIGYDNRILTYKSNDIVSIWTIGGRSKIPFICHNPNYLPYIKGEADLVYKKGKFYLFQTVDIPEDEVENIEEFIGVDFGLTDLVVTSDGIKHTGEWLNDYREKRQRIRSSVQSKGTRSSKRLLKRLSGREKTTATIQNHTISKSIVKRAKEQKKGISIEDLTNIRFTSKRRNKKFKTKLNRWNFGQLRSFLTYKCLLYGVPLVVVNPAFTSQTCSKCKHIGNRKNKSFECKNCGHNEDADINASKNIATLGRAINHVGESNMHCSFVMRNLGSKPIGL